MARPTVFASFGSKPALLKEVLDQALAGDDEPVPVAQRPWFRPVWDAGTPGQVLDAYADVCTLIGARAGHLFEVVRRAADDAPEIAQLWQSTQDNRRAGAKMVIDRLDRDVLALPPSRATDVLWLFNDPAAYVALVEQRGWAKRKFAHWLASTMRAGILKA